MEIWPKLPVLTVPVPRVNAPEEDVLFPAPVVIEIAPPVPFDPPAPLGRGNAPPAPVVLP